MDFPLQTGNEYLSVYLFLFFLGGGGGGGRGMIGVVNQHVYIDKLFQKVNLIYKQLLQLNLDDSKIFNTYITEYH